MLESKQLIGLDPSMDELFVLVLVFSRNGFSPIPVRFSLPDKLQNPPISFENKKKKGHIMTRQERREKRSVSWWQRLPPDHKRTNDATI